MVGYKTNDGCVDISILSGGKRKVFGKWTFTVRLSCYKSVLCFLV